jgi:hypothetical protein
MNFKTNIMQNPNTLTPAGFAGIPSPALLERGGFVNESGVR